MYPQFFTTIFVGNILPRVNFKCDGCDRISCQSADSFLLFSSTHGEGKKVKLYVSRPYRHTGEWKYITGLSKWSNLSALRHSHFTPGVRIPWRPLKRRLFGTQTQPGRHAGSLDFFHPPEIKPRFLGCLARWLISSLTKLSPIPPPQIEEFWWLLLQIP